MNNYTFDGTGWVPDASGQISVGLIRPLVPAFPPNPAVGDTFYDVTLNESYRWDGKKWLLIKTAATTRLSPNFIPNFTGTAVMPIGNTQFGVTSAFVNTTNGTTDATNERYITVADRLAKIEKRLHIIAEADAKKLAQYEALKEAYEKYCVLDTLLSSDD